MRSLCLWTIGLLLGCPLQAGPQMPNLPNPSAEHRVQTLERQASIEQDPTALKPPRLSAAELAAQAAELCRLGQLFHSEIDQAPQPASRSALAAQLKKIEKLSKHLRNEVEINRLR